MLDTTPAGAADLKLWNGWLLADLLGGLGPHERMCLPVPPSTLSRRARFAQDGDQSAGTTKVDGEAPAEAAVDGHPAPKRCPL